MYSCTFLSIPSFLLTRVLQMKTWRTSDWVQLLRLYLYSCHTISSHCLNTFTTKITSYRQTDIVNSNPISISKFSPIAPCYNPFCNVTLSHPVAKCNNNQISDLPYSPESIYPQIYFNVKIVIILWVVIASYCSRFHGTHFWLMCHPIVNKKRKLVNITKGKPFIFYCSNDCIPFQL